MVNRFLNKHGATLREAVIIAVSAVVIVVVFFIMLPELPA